MNFGKILTSYRQSTADSSVFMKKRWLPLITLCALTAIQLVLTPAVNAQTAPDIGYIAKFVCGQQGPSGGGGLPTLGANYQDFQPGGYATVLNILNVNRFSTTLQVRATVAESSPSAYNTRVVSNSTLGRFGAMKVGCGEIASAFNRVNGDLFEGFLYIILKRDLLDVQAVYTYSDQDEFQSQRFLGIGINNQVGDIFAPPPGTNSNVNTSFRIMGGAGAGGLGIGNSIHVERIEPREMPTLPVIEPVQLTPVK